MPEEIQDSQVQSQENPIYKFMKSNNLTKLDEKTFLDTYSKPEKAKEIHSFMISNDLTKLDESKFYDSYLKKKDQTLPSGEISSLTELPSKFIEPLKKGVSPTPTKTKEEEIVLDKLGVKPYTGVTIPTNLPKQDVVKYEKQLKVQDAAINTLIDVYKQKGLKFDPSKPAAQKQIQDYIEKEQSNDLGLVEGIRDKKPYLTRTSGLGETLYSTAIESFKEPIKSTKINTITNPKEFADFADEEIKNTPNVPESVPSNVGGYLGQLGGGLPKLAAEEAVGGPALVAAEMYWNGIANQRKALYQKGLGQGMDRIQAAQMAMDNANTSAIPDFLIGAILAVGVKGHTGILKQGTADAFKDAMKNVVKSSPKMFAVGAGAEFGRAEAQKQAGYKVDRTEEVENMFRGGGDLAKMDAAFKTAMAAPYVPKILYAAAKNVLSETPKPVLDALAQKYGDNGKVVDDVSKFAQTKAEVQDLVPEGKVASVTGLTQKVKNIQQDIDDLTARREKTTDALKPQIDSWIKEYQDEINFYNKQINKVVESKDPTGVTEEVDDITGQKIGTKQYVVDGKEVSQEEFEAMQGKPVGTKQIITEEVKPTEEKGNPYILLTDWIGKENIEETPEIRLMSPEKVKTTLYHGTNDLLQGDIKMSREGIKMSPERLASGSSKEGWGFYTTPNVEQSEVIARELNPNMKDFPAGLTNEPAVKYSSFGGISPNKGFIYEIKLDPSAKVAYDNGLVKDFKNIKKQEFEKLRSLGIDAIYSSGEYVILNPSKIISNKIVLKNTGKKLVNVIPMGERGKLEMNKFKAVTPENLNSYLESILGKGYKKGGILTTGDKKGMTIYYNPTTDEFAAVEAGLRPNWEKVEEVKPTEVKVTEEIKPEAPSKELVEGEKITFKTPKGDKINGEKVVVPGYENMDLVLVKDGFENKIYELASGIEMGGTQEAFSKEAAIESLRKAMEGKKITSDKVHNVIFKGENVKQINPSKKFESYSEERKTKERSDYESLPLKFTPKEIERLEELKNKAVEYGIDKKVKEIEDAISSRAKEGTFKPNTEYFEKILQADIDRKIKKEAEQNKVPYPKEYIQKFPDVTEDYLKTMVNSGYKVDKFAKIPSDVKKIMVNGLQLNRDFVNKYGYHPYEQSDNFFTKLLYFMNSLGARENKEKRAATGRKELISALDDLNKVHEKEFGIKEQIKEPKDELKKAEAKFAAAEDRLKKARNKIEATQVKQAGIFGGEQKGMFAMGGEEAKNTLDPLRKAAKEAKAELDDIRNKIKVQEEAQPELKPIESKTDEEFIDKKIKLIKQQGKPLSEFKVGDKIFWASDWSKNMKQYAEGTIVKAGADYQMKRFPEHPESKRFKIFNLHSNDKVMLKPEGEANYTGKETIFKTKEEVTPYQKALKEKQEAERRLTRQIAGEKAGITRNVIKEASKIEPSDARSAALKYLAGGNLSWEAIDEVAGNVKTARLNTGERELKSEEARSRDYVAKKGQGDDLDDAVHFIWSELHGISEELSGIEDTEIKNALMQAISEYPSKVEAAQALINGYKEVDLEAEEAAFYERYNITEDEVDAELAKLEPTLDKIGDDDYNFGKVPDEHINNLIEQYETEIERQAKQPTKGGKEKITEKVSARETGKPEEAKSVEEAYKDLTKIEKRQIINSKFEELLKELKIEKICPTD